MSVKIRIRNVQSIRDATLVVDGFTVVTGPNNSGKTASQRAVRGVFTNAPSGPLLRHGEDQLTVDLEFSDGNTIKWEKGDKVNRYTVNGKTLSAVGRGVPPEVSAIGVFPVKAGSDQLWPQIAEQFGGVLFLVDRPGSVVAEALSDVDKVGKLTDALRFSESDRRTSSSELKVRLTDLAGYEEEVNSFDGLHQAESEISKMELAFSEADETSRELASLSELKEKREALSDTILYLEGAPLSLLPSSSLLQEASDLQASLSEAQLLLFRKDGLSKEVSSLTGIHQVHIPDPGDSIRLCSSLKEAASLLTSLASSRSNHEKALTAHQAAEKIKLPSVENLQKVALMLQDLKDLERRLLEKKTSLRGEESSLTTAQENFESQATLVKDLLGEAGECPTCKTLCEGVHAST